MKNNIKQIPKEVIIPGVSAKYNNIYDEIFGRMKQLANPCYVNIFAGDDQKKDKKVYSYHFDLHQKNIKEIKEEIEINNIGSLGVFMNFNLLEKPQRNNSNITKILYIFIDLDYANEDDNIVIIENLKSKGIKYSYNCKSGGGYHFLIPVFLEPVDKPLVKGFLSYLKNNVCNNVDVATHTNERLLRCPGSIHNKNKNSFNLETLYYKTLDVKDILNNTSEIKKYQDDVKKGKIEEKYLTEIKKDDTFFSTILNNTEKWNKYIDYLKSSKDRNNNFIKNLGFYLINNKQSFIRAEDLINRFEPTIIGALKGWIKKGKEDNLNVNYYELLRWSKDNNLIDFIELLREQTRKTFLDNYEFYYLLNEKQDNNFLMYYPESDFYIQKSIKEALVNIFYDCKEKGIDLVKEFNLDLIDKWEEKGYNLKLNIILSKIRETIDNQNRIRVVYNINYEPIESKFTYKDNKKFFNIFKKTELLDYYKHSDKYHFPAIKELLMNLCGKNEDNYIWFTKWLAWIIKNPTHKLPTAVILQGKQGSGKGTLKNLILNNLFGSNCREINQTHLESTFNDYLLGKQIIVANEVMHNENRLTLPNILKNLVTDEEITVNIKFKESITGFNYTHWIFCTNSDNPIKIDEDDRRYSVFYSQKLRKGLSHEIRKNLEYELKEFISYLKDLEITFDEVSEPIETEAKKQIIDLNRDSVSLFQEYLGQFNTLTEAYISLFGNITQGVIINDEQTGDNYILTDILFKLYNRYCEEYKERGVFKKQNFSKKMSTYGIISKPKRFSDNSVKRVFDIKDIEKKLILIK